MKRLILIFALILAVRAEVKKVEVGKENEVILQSDDYPQPQSPGESKIWELTTEPDLQIQLECNDIRTSPSPDCEQGYLEISNAVGEGKYCESVHDLIAVSRGNTMKVELVLKRALGVFRCRAITIPKMSNIETRTPTSGDVNIKVGDSAYEINIKTIKRGTQMNWRFRTDSNAKLSLYCTTISINAGGKNCEGMAYMKMTSGSDSKIMCNFASKYTYVSQNNELNLEMRSKVLPVTDVACIVQAITGKDIHQYKNVISYEIDSREHGMTQGSKKTTCPCGTANKSKQNSRVIHGQKATPNEFPFVASLQFNGFHICGGSIITANHILSAAHCTHNKDATKFTILVGQNKNISPFTGQKRPVVKIVDHENYNPQNLYINDISILVVKDKFDFGQNVMPVCLPTPQQQIDINHKYVTLMGWGIAQELGRQRYYPTDLMKTHMRVVDYPVCNVLWSWKFSPSTNPNKFCTWASVRDSCNGDSGGPLVWLDPETNRYTQMGLVSFGRGCNTDWPKINTYVKHYYDWIQKTVKSTSPNVQTCEKV